MDLLLTNMAGSSHTYDLKWDKSDDIESDHVPVSYSGPYHEKEHHGVTDSGGYDPMPITRTSKQLMNYCDSGTSLDSGLGSIARSNLSSTGSNTSKCLSTHSNDSTLSSQFSDLQLSEKECKLASSEKGSTTISFATRKFDVTSAADIDQGLNKKELYSEGFQLTSEATNINQDGDMSLHLAIIFLNPDVALILIALLPVKYLNYANNLQQTPLHLSVLTRQPQITRALIIAGASTDIPDRHGNTALHLACSNNVLDCVGALTHRVLVKEFTDFLGEKRSLRLPQIPQSLELKNYEGYCCIHIATFNANTQLLAYLVQHGANINAADDKSGRRPLHYAVEMRNKDLVEFLLRRLGANVNATTFDLNTPLHLAAGREFSELVYLLMDAGASRQAVNSEGHSPQQVAKSEKLQSALQTVEYSDFTIAGI